MLLGLPKAATVSFLYALAACGLRVAHGGVGEQGDRGETGTGQLMLTAMRQQREILAYAGLEYEV
jgi:hypothetical protein